ncbi:MAG: DNA-3-methyladenine glycosylase I [Prolixibacteraceae bacterium]|nr:DNA-3-methyladenine glycosylase I [Prolixibacteraceae bacterium]
MENRCEWASKNELMAKYHDEEWGRPLHDDQKLFEFLIMEGMQAGLSWLTILKKREAFRIAFDNFDVNKVAKYDQRKVDELMSNPAIIRNKLKIEASINNACRFLEVVNEFGSFDRYIWSFVNFQPIVNKFENLSELPAKTKLSDLISEDLKRKGFKFVGSTIIYAHMQATGMVNDHLTNCFCHPG